MAINIQDRVQINFRREVYIRGGASKTNFVIGTVIDKTTVDHSGVGKLEDHTTYYRVLFDSEYFLEHSNDEKRNPSYQFKRQKFMSHLTLQLDCPQVSDMHLLPISMNVI
jgi:hypothetical protein